MHLCWEFEGGGGRAGTVRGVGGAYVETFRTGRGSGSGSGREGACFGVNAKTGGCSWGDARIPCWDA